MRKKALEHFLSTLLILLLLLKYANGEVIKYELKNVTYLFDHEGVLTDYFNKFRGEYIQSYEKMVKEYLFFYEKDVPLNATFSTDSNFYYIDLIYLPNNTLYNASIRGACNTTLKEQTLLEGKKGLYVIIPLLCNNTFVKNATLVLTFYHIKPYITTVYREGNRFKVEIYASHKSLINLTVVRNATIIYSEEIEVKGFKNYSVDVPGNQPLTFIAGDSFYYYVPKKSNATCSIYISEIYVDPPEKKEPNEFIELYYNCTLAVNLTIFIKKKSFNITLNSSGYWIIMRENFYNLTNNIILIPKLKLANSGGYITILHNNTLLQNITYSTFGCAKNKGCSLHLHQNRWLAAQPTPLKPPPKINNTITQNNSIEVVWLTSSILPYKKEKIFKIIRKDYDGSAVNLTIRLNIGNDTFTDTLSFKKLKTYYLTYKNNNPGNTTVLLNITYKNLTYIFFSSLNILPLNCSFSLSIIPEKEHIKAGNSIKYKIKVNAHYLPINLTYWIEDINGKVVKDKITKSLNIKKEKVFSRSWYIPSLTENSAFYLVVKAFSPACNKEIEDRRMFFVEKNKKFLTVPTMSSKKASTASFSQYLKTANVSIKYKDPSIAIKGVKQINNTLLITVSIVMSEDKEVEIYSYVKKDNKLISYYCNKNLTKKGWKANLIAIHLTKGNHTLTLKNCLRDYGKAKIKVVMLIKGKRYEDALDLYINKPVIRLKSPKKEDPVIDVECLYIKNGIKIIAFTNSTQTITLYINNSRASAYKTFKKNLTLIVPYEYVEIYYNNTMLTTCNKPKYLPTGRFIAFTSFIKTLLSWMASLFR